MSRTNGPTTSYTYTLDDRLTEVLHQQGSSVLADFTTASFGNGGQGLQRTTLAETLGNTNWTLNYVYSNGRLTSESGGPVGSLSYGYDAVGNRTSKVGNGSNLSYAYTQMGSTEEGDDRLLAILSGGQTTFSYHYDANGSVTQAGGLTCTYDFEGHLLSVTDATGVVASFLYDAEGNRIGQKARDATGTLSTTYYTVDANTAYAQVVAELDGSGNVSARYEWVGEELLRSDVGGSGRYFLLDEGNSVRQVWSGGNLLASYTYDAWGNPLVASGQVLSSVSHFLYRGEAWDSATGLYYLRARYYNPRSGRFLSQDPFAGSDENPVSLHRYIYASDDPVNRVDPSGFASATEHDAVLEVVEEAYLNTFKDSKGQATFGKWQYYIKDKGWQGPKGTKILDGFRHWIPDVFDPARERFMELKPDGVYPDHFSGQFLSISY